MNFLLIILFAIIFPVVHIVNGWVFKFAEVSPHIGLIYLPAFMRLANVLILGRANGTVATLLGGHAVDAVFRRGHLGGIAQQPVLCRWTLAGLVPFQAACQTGCRAHLAEGSDLSDADLCDCQCGTAPRDVVSAGPFQTGGARSGVVDDSGRYSWGSFGGIHHEMGDRLASAMQAQIRLARLTCVARVDC